MNGVISKEGEVAATAWAVGLLKELPPEQRSLCLSGLLSDNTTTEGIMIAVNGLSGDDREKFVSSMIARTGGRAETLDVLGSLDREQLIRVLGTTAQENKELLDNPANSVFSSRIKRLFATAEERFSITPDERIKIGY